MDIKHLSYKESFMLTLLVLTLVVSYLFLTHTLHINGYWGGLLFLWYFGHNDTNINKLSEIVIGGSIGIVVAYIIVTLTIMGGWYLAGIACLLPLFITLLISDRFPLLFNQASALTLTIFTFHDLATPSKTVEGFIGFIVGAVFFGSIAWALTLVENKKKMNIKKGNQI